MATEETSNANSHPVERQDVDNAAARQDEPRATSAALSALGFLPAEQWLCRASAGTLLMVPVTVAGVPARLLLDSGNRTEIWLYRSFVVDRALPWEPGVKGVFGKIKDVSASSYTGSGRRLFLGVCVYGRQYVDPGATSRGGGLGVSRLGDSVLGIDPATPAVACSRRKEMREQSPKPVCQFSFIRTPVGEPPVTDSPCRVHLQRASTRDRYRLCGISDFYGVH